MQEDALVILNMQNDFFSKGLCGERIPLLLEKKVIATVNEMIESPPEQVGTWGIVAVSRDWRPQDSGHFCNHGGPSMPYCIAATKGAEFHSDLRLPKTAIIFSKGSKVGPRQVPATVYDPEIDGLSLFDGSAKGQKPLLVFSRFGIKTLFVVGLSVDMGNLMMSVYPIRNEETWTVPTIQDAKRFGFQVVTPSMHP